MPRRLIVVIIICFTCINLHAQDDSISVKQKKQRQTFLAASSSGLTIGSLFWLNQAWYASYNTGQFHFFNDNNEWLQMDKAGHLWTNFQMGRMMTKAFEWAGFNKQKQLIYGGAIGFAYMTGIEIMDGFSRGWGFSWGDELSNASGTALAIIQAAYWQEQKIQLKFSYHASGIAKYNPSLLGKNPGTQILKDYNGQSYWLSFNPFAFCKSKQRWPIWLNLAIGYRAEGMLGAVDNKIVVYDQNSNQITFNRTRHYLFSFDVNLDKIKVRNKTLKKILTAINIIKIPAPAIDISHKVFRIYGIYH